MMFLRCVGEAVVAQGMRGLVGLVPFGDRVYDIAGDAVARYRAARKEAQIAADAEAVVQAGVEQIRVEAAAIARDVAAGHPEDAILLLEAYLTQLPGVARQTLKRPGEPAGRTIPATLVLLDPAQLATLVPRRAPRVRAGEPVPNAPQWRFRELLGAGGFGEVWLAQNAFLGQLRAFKFCLDPASRDRLLRHEGEVVRRVMEASRPVRGTEHGIVPLLDAYLDGDAPWLAYEFVDGGDLGSLARELAAQAPADRARSAVRVLAALAETVGRFHLLPQPIVHRDLKPANVLARKIDGDWVLRVTDFGISHVSADQALRQASVATPSLNLGETFRGAHTPIYASPQQKRGLPADVRDDVYALGIIGYQLITGDLAAERPAGRWRKKLAAAEVPDVALDLLESCWDDDPDERPRSATELADRLRQVEKAPASAWEDVRADYRAYEALIEAGTGSRPWLEKHLANIPRWQAGAAHGIPGAMVLVGDCFEEGIGVTQDDTEAMAWYRKAAEAGDGTAMYCVGSLVARGRGVAADAAAALAWYEKAAAAGNVPVMLAIGHMYYSGDGVPQDYEQALGWYQRAAAAGSGSAMDAIGGMCRDGVGVLQDIDEAVTWFQKGAAAGSGYAMNSLGCLYRDGNGVEQDYAEAYAWYRKGAEAGNEWAMDNLGDLYRDGNGVDQDYAEAVSWYWKAATAGDSNAMNSLGDLYLDGHGVDRDFAVALDWYRRAADTGNTTGMVNVGWMYQRGKGVGRSRSAARDWYQRALDAGDESAQEHLDSLES